MSLRKMLETGKVAEQKPCSKLITHPEFKDVATVAAQFLTTRDFVNVSKTCRGSRALFAPARTNNRLQNLLQAVVFGDINEVEKIINSDPTLLLKSGTVIDYSGRTHLKRTAFQLALGACDYHLKDKKEHTVVSGMVEKIETLFNKLPGKTDDMHDQYIGQFPEDHKALEAKRVTEDSIALHRMIDVMTDLKDQEDFTVVSKLDDIIHKIMRKEKSELANKLNKLVQNMLSAKSEILFDEAFVIFHSYVTDCQLVKNSGFNVGLLKALYQFRWHLEPKGYQTIGKHFNHELLNEVAKLYEKNYEQFGDTWKSPKNSFYLLKVMGGVQRLVPACDAQVIACGLYYVLENGEKSLRTLYFRESNAKYYPLALDADWETGYNCAVNNGGDRSRFSLCTWARTFSDFVSRKNISVKSYQAAWAVVTKEKQGDKVDAGQTKPSVMPGM